jgi:hypothetical protein
MASERSRLREQQQAETTDTYAGLGLVPGPQARGFALGAVTGAVIGAILVTPFGFIDWGGGFDLWLRLLLAAIVGVIAGSTVGAVFGAGRKPQLEGATDELSDPD